MKAITIALFGTCLVLAAHGIPISQSTIHLVKNTDAVAPRTVSSSHASQLTSTSGFFYRVDGYEGETYYYQAFEISVKTTGTYTFSSDSDLDTIGYFYQNNFDPSEPTVNLFLDDDDSADHFQFRIEANLEAEHVYILVVTTHAEDEVGNFVVLVEGPEAVNINSFTPSTVHPITASTTPAAILSAVSSTLSSTDSVFDRFDGEQPAEFHYQAFEVRVPTAGFYSFISDSKLDTIGYFYENSFDPSVPHANLVTDDDDGHENFQFRIEVYLEPEHTYVLVVTTHEEFATGDFVVETSGPDSVSLSSFTPSTSRPIVPATGGVVPVLSSVSSELSSTGDVFYRVGGYIDEVYHFQAFEIHVQTAGFYTFASESDLDTMGYFYQDKFDPSIPSENLMLEDDDGHTNLQFSINVYLEPEKTYVLVVTTHKGSETGSFSVSSTGVETVHLNAFAPVTSQPLTAVTVAATVESSMAGELSAKQIYVRPDGVLEENYYYQTIQVNAPKSGMYHFSSTSDLDTMGYLYKNSFDPLKPTENLIMEDDDSGDHLHQFGFRAFLDAEFTYFLVVTTHREATEGSFSVITEGPASVNFRTSA